MKQHSLIILLAYIIAMLLSCDPDDIDPCDLNSLNGKIYSGYVTLCNAMPGSQVDFGAKATIDIVDGKILINVIDTVNFYTYNESIEVVSECNEGEPNTYSHMLFDANSNINVGQIHTKNSIMALTVNRAQCLESIHFDGDVN